MGLDPTSGRQLPLLDLPNDHFPMRILVWILSIKLAGLIPDYELGVRFFLTLCILFNALILGCLVNRFLHSKFASVVCSWLFISPALSAEAVLWISTSAYIFSVGFAILSIICFHLALAKSTNKFLYIFLSTMFLSAMMFSLEGCMATIGIIFLVAFFHFIEKGCSLFSSIRSTIIYTLFPLIILGIIVIIFRNSPLIVSRGGTDTSISFLLDRLKMFQERFAWLLFSDDWGRKILSEAFFIGCNEIYSSVWVSAIFLISIGLLVITAISWQSIDLDSTVSIQRGFYLLIVSIIWVISGILIPGIFSKGQIIEYRMLYFPTAGICMVVATSMWLILKLFASKTWLIKLFIVISGVILLFNSTVMLGFCQIFKERNQIDSIQLTSVKALLPDINKIPSGTMLLLHNFDSNFEFNNLGNISNKLLFGVFETTWSAEAGLNNLYQRTDLKTIVINRWTKWEFIYKNDLILNIQGNDYAIAKILFITYKGKTAFVVDKIIVESKDASTQEVVFPIARHLKLNGVVTNLNLIEISDGNIQRK